MKMQQDRPVGPIPSEGEDHNFFQNSNSNPTPK